MHRHAAPRSVERERVHRVRLRRRPLTGRGAAVEKLSVPDMSNGPLSRLASSDMPLVLTPGGAKIAFASVPPCRIPSANLTP